MPFFVDEHIAFGVGKVQELLQYGIDLVDVILVIDEPFFSDIVTVGYDGPPPELLEKLTCKIHHIFLKMESRIPAKYKTAPTAPARARTIAATKAFLLDREGSSVAVGFAATRLRMTES